MKNKTIFFLVILILSIALSKKLKLRNVSIEPGCIRAYPECDYKGDPVDLCGLNVSNNSKKLDLKSFEVGPNTEFYLFGAGDHPDEYYYKINQACFKEIDIFRIASGKISSEEASIFCVKLWEDCNYRGKSIEVCQDFDLSRMFYLNDFANSIELGDYVKATIFSEGGFSGQSQEITENIECFGWDWSRKISSIYLDKKLE